MVAGTCTARLNAVRCRASRTRVPVLGSGVRNFTTRHGKSSGNRRFSRGKQRTVQTAETPPEEPVPFENLESALADGKVEESTGKLSPKWRNQPGSFL